MKAGVAIITQINDQTRHSLSLFVILTAARLSLGLKSATIANNALHSKRTC